jgi:putative SOS response-associated peptidase YedK
MCGRFAQTKELSILISRFNFIIEDLEIRKRYNIAPGQDAAVILGEGGSRRLKMMRWGLVPFWTSVPPGGAARINTRVETMTEKPSFRQSFKTRRCLVPADGYYEWKKIMGTGAKIPFFFSLKKMAPFAFAGIWDVWQNPEGAPLYSFSIVTTGANAIGLPIHDRMPAILPGKAENLWIDPEFGDVNKLAELIKPFPAEEMEVYEVSRLVNSPKNDSPDCIKKSSGPRQELLF